MSRYFLTTRAVEDLSRIWEYSYDVWSEAQADKYYHAILDTCAQLANKSLVGKIYPEIHDEILGFKVGQHIIFYRQVKSNIEIARILHSRMDLKRQIKD